MSCGWWWLRAARRTIRSARMPSRKRLPPPFAGRALLHSPSGTVLPGWFMMRLPEAMSTRHTSPAADWQRRHVAARSARYR
ncbi:hypothetical protein [Sphingomonas aquatica]|uniref:hypothetical protein n=1 Tax=Sphingomonas aquatica TaxID=1763824 RepID=UPI00301CE4D5